MRRELLYTILFFVIFEFIATVDSVPFFAAGVWVGLILLLTWIFLAFVYYSGKKVSRFSEVIIKMQLKVRWYNYVFVPIAFFLSICAFIFFVKSTFLAQFMIIFGCVCLFGLMVHIRATYQNLQAVSQISRAVFDYINVIFFYVLSTTLSISGSVEKIPLSIIMGFLAFFILVADLKMLEKPSFIGTLFAVVGGAIIIGIGVLAIRLNIYIFPFILTLGFYTVFSFWHIRLTGEKRLDHYIPPILFLLMSLILVLS